MSGLTIHVNRASGAFDPDGTGTNAIAASPLTWGSQIDQLEGETIKSMIDTDESGAFNATGVSVGGMPITLTSDDLLLLAGDLTDVSLANGFVKGRVHFELSKQLVDVHLATGDLTDAVLLSLGLSQLNLTVGDPASVHVSITSGSLCRSKNRTLGRSSPTPDLGKRVSPFALFAPRCS